MRLIWIEDFLSSIQWKVGALRSRVSSYDVLLSFARSLSDDTVSEWLRRWTRNPLGSARRGSNPLGVVFSFFVASWILQLRLIVYFVGFLPPVLCDSTRDVIYDACA